MSPLWLVNSSVSSLSSVSYWTAMPWVSWRSMVSSLGARPLVSVRFNGYDPAIYRGAFEMGFLLLFFYIAGVVKELEPGPASLIPGGKIF